MGGKRFETVRLFNETVIVLRGAKAGSVNADVYFT